MSNDNTAPGPEGENGDDATGEGGVEGATEDAATEIVESGGDAGSGGDEDAGQSVDPFGEREAALAERAEELDRREERIDQREEGLDKRAEDLSDRAAELDEREERLRERREELVDREDGLDEREARIEEAEQEIADRRVAITEREEALDERAAELDRQEATLERYVQDQLEDVEESLTSTVQESVFSAVDGISVGDDGGRFGTVGNVLLGFVGLVLTVGGIANAVAIQFGFSGAFGDPLFDYGLSAFVIVIGLAANLAAAASRV